MKIYLAGKWQDRMVLRQVMNQLEKEGGHIITHDWTSFETANPESRSTDILGECARRDIEGVRVADVLIALMNDPKYPYRGTSTEIGAALALGKPVYIICPLDSDAYCKQNCFYWHPGITHFRYLNEVPGLFPS